LGGTGRCGSALIPAGCRYLAVLLAFLTLQIAAARTRAPVLSLGAILTRIMRTRTGRVGVLVAWAWLGLHFFAQ
jgi:Family of unknown function (DUF6186)